MYTISENVVNERGDIPVDTVLWPAIFCLNYLQLNFEGKKSIHWSWRIALLLFVKWKFCNNPYLVNLLTLSDAFGTAQESTVIMISII